MPDIHLVERLNNKRLIVEDANVWESGYWALSKETADSLVGGHIFLHEGQLKPSYMGGTILGYRIQRDGEYEGRVIFIFFATSKLKGVTTSKAGWGNEKKIVRGSIDGPFLLSHPPDYQGAFGALRKCFETFQEKIDFAESIYRMQLIPNPVLDHDKVSMEISVDRVDMALLDLEGLIKDIRASVRPEYGVKFSKNFFGYWPETVAEYWVVFNYLTKGDEEKKLEFYIDKKTASNRAMTLNEGVCDAPGAELYHIKKVY